MTSEYSAIVREMDRGLRMRSTTSPIFASLQWPEFGRVFRLSLVPFPYLSIFVPLRQFSMVRVLLRQQVARLILVNVPSTWADGAATQEGFRREFGR